MTVAPNIADENTVRRFLEIISAHAVELAKGVAKPGVLQLSTLSPVDETLIPHRFRLDDVDGMVGVAVAAANAGLNVYIEARTLRPGLRGKARGTIADTEFVFGLVVDADHDKGKGGNGVVRPSLTVETSPGNFHYWYLFDKPGEAEEGRRIGDLVRAHSGTDQDTGVVTQCYRIAGTPNYPSKAKQARGRTSVEPTRIGEWTGRLWDLGEINAVRRREPFDRLRASCGAVPQGRRGRGAHGRRDRPCLTSSWKPSAMAGSARGTGRRATSPARGSFTMSSGN